MSHVLRLSNPLQVDRRGSGPCLELRVRRNDVFVEGFSTDGGEVRGGESMGRHMGYPSPPHEKDEMAKAIRFEMGINRFRCRKNAVELSAVFLIAL